MSLFFFCGFRSDRGAASSVQQHHRLHRGRGHGAVRGGRRVFRVSARPLSPDEGRRRDGHQRLRGPRAVVCAAGIRAAPQLAVQLAARWGGRHGVRYLLTLRLTDVTLTLVSKTLSQVCPEGSL